MGASEAIWVREGTELMLKTGSGPPVEVEALDIYDAEFEGLKSVSGFTVARPSEVLEGVRFWPNLAIHKFHLKFDGRGIVLQLSIESVVSPGWPETSHTIVGATWYAIQAVALAEQRTCLTNHGIALGGNLNHRDVLWLLWDSELDVDASDLPEHLSSVLAPGSAEAFDSALLQAVLYPYQIEGSTFLVRVCHLGLGALLADEMGLGKTMQALYLLADSNARSELPSLVVAPSSTLANWAREITRFAPSVTVILHAGARRSGDPAVLSSYAVVLTSYDVLVRDQALFREIRWETIVLDEAQAIKNSAAQRSSAAKSLSRNSSVAVTGTPIENTLRDMWSIFEFVAPTTLGTLEQFMLQYPDEVEAAQALSKRVAPLVMRRTVAEVAGDLPPRIDSIVPIFASERLARLYDEVRLAPGDAPIVVLTRLRQLCANPSILDEGWGSISTNFPKMDRLVEILDEVVATRGKALIFASFTPAIDEITAVISKRYESVFVEIIDGRKQAASRQGIIDEFTARDGAALLVMNPRAAGVGLNIQAANHVIHFTTEWNPAIIAQASARAHRRGQTRPVFVHYLYYVDTVEEVMMNRLEEKRNLQRAALANVSDEPSARDMAAALRLSPNR